MPDIRLEVGFLDHLKTRRLQKRCKADGVLALLRLWIYAATNAPDGHLDGMADDEIEDIAGWDGTPGRLISALRDLRWVDGEQGAYTLHDWSDWQRWAMHAPDRRRRAQHAASTRWAKRDAMQDAMPDACGEHARSNAPSPAPSPSPSPSPEEPPYTPPPTPSNGRNYGPQELTARSLSKALGSSLNTCRKQIAALVLAGWSIPRITAAIQTHARPGIAPWTWTTTVTAADSKADALERALGTTDPPRV